jgi:hypothetical protein
VGDGAATAVAIPDRRASNNRSRDIIAPAADEVKTVPAPPC